MSPGPSPESRRTARGRRTCLYCYAPLRVERGVEPCGQCGETQTRIEQERYWTREPFWVRLERLAKGLAIAGTLGLATGTTFVMDSSSLVWGFGLVAAIGALLWYTAGCVTRRAAFMDLRFLWPPLLVAVAFGPMLFSTLLRWIGGEGAAESSAENTQASGWIWAVAWMPAIAISLTLPRIFARMRQERVESGGE